MKGILKRIPFYLLQKSIIMENLSKHELVSIGGGGVFANTSSLSSISISASADSLLSLSFITVNGDRRDETKISVGNNTHLNFRFLGINQ